jgi:hypothetical protein
MRRTAPGWTLVGLTTVALTLAPATVAPGSPGGEPRNATPVRASVATGPLPDLVVRLAAPDAAAPGSDIGPRVHLAVKNIGSATAWGTRDHPSGYMIDLTLGRDGVVPVGFKVYSPHYTDNVLLEGGRVSRTVDVAPAVTERFRVGAGIPGDTPPGDYFLCAYGDPGNVVRESNERNNVRCVALRILAPGAGEGRRSDQTGRRDGTREERPSPHRGGFGAAVVTGLSSAGCVDRGGMVTLYGEGFGGDRRGRLVELGGHGIGLIVEITHWSSREITVVVPDDRRLETGQSYYLGIQDADRNWLSNFDKTITICRGLE